MPANTDDASVEPLVRKTAAWAWRLLIILAALIALLWVVKRLEVIVVPVLVALLLSALLLPVVDWLDRRGLPRGGAVTLVLLGGFGILGGILAFVVIQFIDGVPGLTEQVTR
ncbi:AI-2E family transporter, partial [Mycobacterium sp. E2497]|uniref:AI-2E family transporter n=2 Tax=Mycobacterium TaxID=1763 RepID=UPI000AA95C48